MGCSEDPGPTVVRAQLWHRLAAALAAWAGGWMVSRVTPNGVSLLAAGTYVLLFWDPV